MTQKGEVVRWVNGKGQSAFLYWPLFKIQICMHMHGLGGAIVDFDSLLFNRFSSRCLAASHLHLSLSSLWIHYFSFSLTTTFQVLTSLTNLYYININVTVQLNLYAIRFSGQVGSSFLFFFLFFFERILLFCSHCRAFDSFSNLP